MNRQRRSTTARPRLPGSKPGLPPQAKPCLPTVAQVVLAKRPETPLHCLRPGVIVAEAGHFARAFPGRVLYAVKCNPEPAVLAAVARGGVGAFDAASVAEVRLVRRVAPTASIHFMHPVKPRSAIREAWERHGVRDFSLDSAAELSKILAETGGGGPALGLMVRLALPKGGAMWDLSGKFGAEPPEAARLLRLARGAAGRVGVCFHVGSQCLDPGAFERALALAGAVIDTAGVPVDVVDVGGGFPVAYPDVVPPPLEAFMAAIARGVTASGLSEAELWCEPGRALVAPGASLVVQVLGRRGGALFVNDGIYGSLSDAGPPGFRFPCRLIRPPGAGPSGPMVPFSLFGPTCDSADRMNGPFLLPDDVGEGDWIEIGQLGAYGAALRTAFNGFGRAVRVDVRDPPLSDTAGQDERAA